MAQDEHQGLDTVHDLISRYRTGSSPTTKKRERTASPLSESDSAKRAMKDDSLASSGKFLMRAAKPSQRETINFINKIYAKDEDPETDNLMALIRGTSIADLESEEKTASSSLTTVLIKQDSDSEAEEEMEDRDHMHTPDIDEHSHRSTPDTVTTDIPPVDLTGTSPHSESEPLSEASDLEHDFEALKVSQGHRRDGDNTEDEDDGPGCKFEQTPEPEEKKAKGPVHDDSLTPMVTSDALSHKEQISEKLLEKDISEAQEEESGDELADLPLIRKGRCGESTSSSLEGTELDFSILEGTTNQLNVDANKQKVVLRQKGSLAKRRKPTRSSMRSRASEDDMFEDSTEMRQYLNGDEDMYVDDSQVTPEVTSEQNSHRGALLMEESAGRSGTNLQGLKTPVLLPGLGDPSKIKLRHKAPVALPKKKDEEKIEAPSEDAAPPWMSEVRQRRQSRQPRGEVEKLNEEKKPETPAWMKDALAKKKRATQVMQQKQELQAKEREQSSVEDSSIPPWMKERAVRKTNRPSPLKATTKDVAYSNNTVNTLDSDNIYDRDTPTKWRATSTSVISSKEILSPLKRGSVDNVHSEPDENTPPNTDTVFKDELPQKAILPPLRPSLSQTSVSSTSSSKNEDENESSASVPSWRSEIAARKKSKSFVPIQRPEQPLRLGETPQWKKDLMDRKSKRESIGEIPKPQPEPAPSDPSVPPWKKELNQRKKRNSLTPRVLEPIAKSQQSQQSAPSGEQPEWARQVERRRARLASSGLIKHEET